ncbi:MAG: phosphatidylglycerol lysyltransferase domain-containing protein [Clostridium perfringens]|nr:phosphatidylglycerol lysyltransferase domain-containing protein [Clostridium perfringens]
MKGFKSLTLEDKNILSKYFKNINTVSYEYLFSSLFIWRDVYNIQYTIINDALIILRKEDKGKYFMAPLGYTKASLPLIVNSLKNLSYNDDDFYFLFGDVEEDFKNCMEEKFKDDLEITEDVNDFEYIYKTKDLINLKGSKYHKKRNHYNMFKRLYNYTIKEISNDKIKNDCLNFLDTWANNKNTLSFQFKFEKYAILECLSNLKYLDLKSIALYDNNSLIGFSLGEISNNTGIIHIEKANNDYNGIYSFLNKEFLLKDFSKTTFINRQEDCGDLGLRQSKESYYPIQKLKKYWIRVKT